MAKKKNIADIVYFPKKQHQDCDCSKCNRFIDSTTIAHLVGHLNSNEMMCGLCVNKLFTKKQVAKDKGAAPYDVSCPLHDVPNIDDGNQSIEESLQLIKLAAEKGVQSFKVMLRS